MSRIAPWLATGFALMLALPDGPAQARDPFLVDLTVDGRMTSRSYSSLDAAVLALSNGSLRRVDPGYTDISAASGSFNLRGVPGVASFDANSPVLRVLVPAAGINENFQGATRDESVRLFRRYIEGRDGNEAVNRLLRAQVRASPVDPVAGNPNAALTQVAVADYGRALTAGFGDRSGAGLGARFGSFTAAGYQSTNITVPLDATWRITERDTLEVDVPLSYTDSSGASSYSGNVGLIYRRQVTDNWTLQPSVRVGAAGSVDLGGGSGLYGLGLVSTLRFDLDETWRLTVANGINYVSTFPTSFGRYSIDYNVANTIFRNGVVVSRDLGFEVLGRPLAGSAFFVDTRFTGSGVFIRNYQEFGVFISAGREARGGLGLTLLTGDRGLFGVTLNTGVKF